MLYIRLKMRALLCLLTGMGLMVLINASVAYAENDSDRQALINLTRNYFNAVGGKDIDTLQEILLPQAQFIYRNGEEVDSTIEVTSAVHLLENLPELNNELFERMQTPTVLVQGDIGMVWTRYDFYENKIFSHCGTDAFIFLNTKDGWKSTPG